MFFLSQLFVTTDLSKLVCFQKRTLANYLLYNIYLFKENIFRSFFSLKFFLHKKKLSYKLFCHNFCGSHIFCFNTKIVLKIILSHMFFCQNYFLSHTLVCNVCDKEYS